MAITFKRKAEKQKSLFWFFLAVILVAFSVLYFGFLKKGGSSPPPPPPQPSTYVPPKIEINFEALNNPLLKDLLPFEEIKPFEGKPGRANPFEPF